LFKNARGTLATQGPPLSQQNLVEKPSGTVC